MNIKQQIENRILQYLKDTGGLSGGSDVGVAVTLINEMDLQGEMHWNPVEESLPEPEHYRGYETLYIVQDDTGQMHFLYYVYEPEDNDRYFYCPGKGKLVRPVAWMLAPKPYCRG